MSARRITRSQSKTSRSTELESGIPLLPRHADLAIQRQKAKTLPTRRRLQTDAADSRSSTGKRNAFQQADDEADVVGVRQNGRHAEEEDEEDQDGAEYDDDEGEVGEDDEETEDDERVHQPAVTARRSPSKHREQPKQREQQPITPSSRSLFRQLLSFLWTVWKYSLIVSLLALLTAPIVLVFLQPTFLASPLLHSSSHSVLSTLRHVLTSFTAVFHKPPSSTTIAHNIHGNLSSIVDQLTQQHPAYATSLRRTIEPSLDDHFDLSNAHSANRPLVFFIAHSPAVPVSELQSFAYDVSSLLYPVDVPSYLLDLTDIAGQKHFDGRHLDSLLKQHFTAHNDGLVLLPSLTALHQARSVGETLQHWLDEDRSPARRAVFLLSSEIDVQSAKQAGELDKLRAAHVKDVVYERLRSAMHESKDGAGKSEAKEDELIDAILNRLVRNVVVLK